MLNVEPMAIPEVKLITPKRHGDERGFFSEVYKLADFEDAGLDCVFIQDNHSSSTLVGTLRGLHFQSNPYPQHKLVRVTRGRILDVAVDIRRSSPTFGRSVGVELSAENWQQLLVPVGFAHGFVTLEPMTEVQYKVSAPYAPRNDHGLAFDDPQLAIDWGMPHGKLLLSDKDRRHPRLADLPAYFD